MLLSQEISRYMVLIHRFVQEEDAGSIDPKLNVLPLGLYANFPIIYTILPIEIGSPVVV